MEMPDGYGGYACPNPKCREIYLEGLYTGAVRTKCQACKHTVEFVGDRKPRSVDLGINPAPAGNGFTKVLCAECKRWICDHKGGGWFLIKCSKCRNYNIFGDGTVTSVGRDTDREKMRYNK
jgi:phage FluMu protein Com